MEQMWLDTRERHGIKRDPPRKHLGKKKVCSCLKIGGEGRGEVGKWLVSLAVSNRNTGC